MTDPGEAGDATTPMRPTTESPRVRRRTRGWYVVVVVAVVAVIGLGVTVAAQLGGDEMAAEEGAQLAGFEGVAVDDFVHYGGIDDEVQFSITGSSEEIDQVLEQAEVRGPWVTASVSDLPDGPRPLIDARSTVDSYVRGPGTGSVMRGITRAELENGDEVLLVRASRG